MTWWFRFWPRGPGVAVYDTRKWIPFSVRYNHIRHLRLWRYVFVAIPSLR